jgi:hypothetical protein
MRLQIKTRLINLVYINEDNSLNYERKDIIILDEDINKSLVDPSAIPNINLEEYNRKNREKNN